MLAIAACDLYGVMGKDGGLPWHCPEDLAFFSAMIGNAPLVMGRKTWDSLPRKYAIGRKIFVCSHRPVEGVTWISSLEQLRNFSDAFLIGGGSLFAQCFQLNLIERCYLTQMKRQYMGDTYFPLPALNGWEKVLLSDNSVFTLSVYFKRIHEGYPCTYAESSCL